MVGQVVLGVLLSSTTTQAIPAFARKYQVNCQVCHTRMPRLNLYGERFLENGYQLPGTEDGSHRGGEFTVPNSLNYFRPLYSLH